MAVPLDEAVRRLVRDGDTVAPEGFTHLLPVAAGHEAIGQGLRDLTLVRMTPDRTPAPTDTEPPVLRALTSVA